MRALLFSIVLVVGLGLFARIMYGRFGYVLHAKPAKRLDRLGERVWNTFVYAFGQKKFLTGEQPSGIMHALIFWGFMVLVLTVVTMFGRAFIDDFDLPGFAPGHILGGPYILLRDAIELAVIVAVAYMLYRRLIAHTPRLFGFRPAEERLYKAPHWEGIMILFFITGIMVSGLLYEGGRFVELAGEADVEQARDWAFASDLVSNVLPASAAATISEASWWVHNVIVLAFLNLLPLSKHFHIITAIPNVFFSKLEPRSARRERGSDGPAMGIAMVEPEAGGASGTSLLNEFTWKQVLDMYSCTECGRCTAQCPATASGSALAPRQFILDLRDFLYQHPEQMTGAGNGAANGAADKIIPDEVLWGCTTCGACVEACPVGIEHVPTIIQMRRNLVDKGEMEPMLQDTLKNFAQQGNSYGKSSRMRARWAKGLDFTIPDARKEPVKYLWFVGDFASFDERSQEASRRVARILHAAGVSFGMLYDAERNSGNDVRRVGEEGLFEMLVEQNMEAFASAEFEAIFTTDPHSLNALRNEYPAFGEMAPVYHYTELLMDLIERGELRVSDSVTARATYHDPCYLARYNRIIEAPRRLIAATGVELVEMPRNGANTFCCGAGGGRIWMDDSVLSERPSEQRMKEAEALGEIDYFIVTCPKDLAMYSDAAKTVGSDIEVVEVTELLERALGQAEPALVGAVLDGDAPATEPEAEAAAGAPE